MNGGRKLRTFAWNMLTKEDILVNLRKPTDLPVNQPTNQTNKQLDAGFMSLLCNPHLTLRNGKSLFQAYIFFLKNFQVYFLFFQVYFSLDVCGAFSITP